MLNHQGSPVLFTQRLRLRPYRAGDGAQMFSAWAGDAQVTKYMGFSTHADPGVTERLAQLWVDGYESPTVYRWGVEYQGELAGISRWRGGTRRIAGASWAAASPANIGIRA